MSRLPYLLLIKCAFFVIPSYALEYYNEAREIIAQNCLSCHSEGGAAAFYPLTNYQEVLSRSSSMYRWVKNREMPPYDVKIHKKIKTNLFYLDDIKREKLLSFLKNPIMGKPTVMKELTNSFFNPETKYKESFKLDVNVKIPKRGAAYKCVKIEIPKVYKNKYLRKFTVSASEPNKKYIHHFGFLSLNQKHKKEKNVCDRYHYFMMYIPFGDTGFKLLDTYVYYAEFHFESSHIDEQAKTIKTITVDLGFDEDVPSVVYPYVYLVPYQEIKIPYGQKQSVSGVLDFKKMRSTLEKEHENLKNKVMNISSAVMHMHSFGKRGQLKLIKNKKKVNLITHNNFRSEYEYPLSFKNGLDLSNFDSLEIICDFDNSPSNLLLTKINPTKSEVIGGGMGDMKEMCGIVLNISFKEKNSLIKSLKL